MHGVFLFGSEGNNHSVNLTITQLPSNTTVVSTSGRFPSLCHKSKKFWGFDVLLESPVSLIEGKRYHIEAHISGPKSFGGGRGNIHIESSGVTFNFEDGKRKCFDGTGVGYG